MDTNSALASFYNFLSVIFGILGKFGIEIGEQKHFIEFFFAEKKSVENFVEHFLGPNIFRFLVEKTRTLLVEKNLGTHIFRFLTKHFSLKKSMKIQNFEISEKIENF